MKNILFVFIAGLALGGFFLWPRAAASPSPQFRRPQQSQAERELEERQLKMANKKRQEDIQKDTQKLLALATELKEAVDKSNENMLSLDVVRKAEEVEKLAKKVKEKMKEGTGKPLHAEPSPVEILRQ